MPTLYYTGHGHIVDSSLSTSPQFDVIVADNTASPILFRSGNGTEYFPYESIYAFGEIKSTYYSSKSYVSKFVDSIRSVRQELHRELTPPSYLGNGVSLGSGLSTGEKRPFKNPLFSFMLFVNSGDFAPSQLNELYKNTTVAELPNVICLLDKGIVVNVQVLVNERGELAVGSLNAVPEMSVGYLGGSGHWAFIPYGDDSTRPGSNFAALWFLLINHLRSTTLLAPNMLTYLDQLFTYESGELIG